LAKASNDLIDVFESQRNLFQSKGLLASPKWSKHLNTPTSNLKCGDMSGSTSTDKKSKDKDFVATKVNELNHKIYNQQRSNPSFKFSFLDPYFKLNLVMFIPCVTSNVEQTKI